MDEVTKKSAEQRVNQLRLYVDQLADALTKVQGVR